MEGEPRSILQVKNVTKSFGKFKAIDNLNLSLSAGKHLLLLGPNGAGKTTLIRCIMDLINYYGEIRVDGVDPKRDGKVAKGRIGYVAQNEGLYEGLTVEEHARLATDLKKVPLAHIQDKLETVGMWEKRKLKVKALSEGMRHRLGIALALIGDPPLLILDEPTSSIDMKGQIEVQGILRRLLDEGRSVLTTTHLTGLGELADEVAIIDKGRLLSMGSPADLLAKINASSKMYVRVQRSRIEPVMAFISGELHEECERQGDWIAVSVHRGSKIDAARRLLVSEQTILDIVIERTSIESEYLKLLNVGVGA